MLSEDGEMKRVEREEGERAGTMKKREVETEMDEGKRRTGLAAGISCPLMSRTRGEAHGIAVVEEELDRLDLGEAVGDVVGRGDVDELNGASVAVLAEEVDPKVDVFGPVVVDWVLRQGDGAHVVVVDGRGTVREEFEAVQEATKPDGLASGIAGSHVLGLGC